MHHPRILAASAALVLAAATVAQTPDATAAAERKLHPYLEQLVRVADPAKRLPVYFVIGERLGYDHWFPRVYSMKLAVRRATVMSELQEHATRTQRDLLDYLAAEQRAGDVANVRSNWLGNFVLAEATPMAILTAATDPSVTEVWYDYSPPLEAVQDGDDRTVVAEPIGPPAPRAASTAAPLLRIPGNGPTAVFADRVWAFGIEGQGVLVQNTDQGIGAPAFHTDLIQRVWVNPGEIAGNNLDDDNNGFVDDVNGWNFNLNTNAINDGGAHGTNTSGCIVADGSCNGTTYGMAPQARLMIGAINGEATMWAALQYGLLMGADVQTSSYSYKSYFNPPPNYKMHRDVGITTLAAGLIRTNSTSNDGGQCASTTNMARKPFNISAPGNLPPPYLDPNQTLRGQLGGVLGVAACTLPATTALASYSPCGPFAWNLPDLLVNVPAYPLANWNTVNHNDYPWTGGTQQGLLKPDVSAPTGTTTTYGAPCSFGTFSGTSNATPCANGVLALWKCANPSLTPEDVGMIVHQTASDRGVIAGKENNWGAGVIHAENGLYRALCVHRVDGQPAWSLTHSVASGAIQYALDGVPSSLAAVVLGFSRAPVNLGPVTVSVGPTIVTLAFGLTDAQGDLNVPLSTSAALVGLQLFSQALVQDLTITNRILASNVIGTTIVP